MPRYDYRCPTCGQVDEITHSFDDDPDIPCMECGTPMRRLFTGVRISASATPTRSSNIDIPATAAAEKQKAADMDAYKRLRRNGTQPPAINGSAGLESKAETVHEVNSGRTFNTARSRRRNIGLVNDILGKS